MIDSKGKFGTFGGVFVPNILTILGVIMYLRMGWVVGNAGLHHTLIILLIANLITLITSFSMSSIATNMKVRGGGAYYMISRSLGAEAGGSIGIPLFLAQALGISLYIVGFSESITSLFPELNVRLITLVTLCALTVLALISSGLVIKTQFIILGIVFLSLISLFSGKILTTEGIHLNQQYSGDYNFWSVFAVFFPAVTGILSGVSLSGDLRDPARSIPIGTILSVIAGALIYLFIAVWLSVAASPEELIQDNMIMISIARWGPLIYTGIWGATLSSALANLMAAPRTLQSLARDGMVFKLLSKGRGEQNEPIRATVLTFILVAGVLWVGELNTIAPVLTMFFLITYGSINFISFIESLIKRPGFRPTFRVHWGISLLGAAGCIWVMFVINPLACVIGFAFVTMIYLILKRIQMQKSWGDVRRGIWSAVIKYALLNLERLRDHHGAWRPNVLLFGRNLISKPELVKIAFGLTQKSGFLTCINLFESGNLDPQALEEESGQFKEMLNHARINAFYRNAVVDNYLSGQMIASQTHGIGDFRHNTILLDWAESTGGGFFRISSEKSNQFKLIRLYSELKNSLLLLNVNPDIRRPGYRTIDIWWDPSQKNGSFMLMLAHLLASSTLLDHPKLTIKTVVLREKLEQTTALLEELVKKSRIKAGIEVLSPDSIQELNLSLQFERSRKMQRVQEKWFGGIRKLFVPPDKQADIPYPPDAGDGEPTPGATSETIGAPVGNEETAEDSEIKEKLSDQVREKDIFIIDKNINEIIISNSKGADLVMLGFNIPAQGKEKDYIGKMEALLEKLPDTLFVNCPFDLELYS
jgi:amino acid transporter